MQRAVSTKALACMACREHAYQWLCPGTLEAIADFVLECGGQIDMPSALLSMEIQSRHQAD